MAGSPSTNPIATHVIAVGQETVESESVSLGGVCAFQVVPSMVLLIIESFTAVH
jgi:hypothetical protein